MRVWGERESPVAAACSHKGVRGCKFFGDYPEATEEVGIIGNGNSAHEKESRRTEGKRKGRT